MLPDFPFHYFIAFILVLSSPVPHSVFYKNEKPFSFSSFHSTCSLLISISLSLSHYPMSNPTTNGDLTSPLLSDVILTISDQTTNGDCATTTSPPPNPYDFLGAPPLEIAPPSPIDPFRNHTPGFRGLYEWCKILIILPVVALRLVLFGLCIAVGYVATWVALQGWKDLSLPLTSWRRRLMWITRICARCILFSFGYHWIKRKGKPAPRELAPIVVSNHVSYIDPIYYFYELCPTIVASESHDSMPFVGTIIRAMQVIYVDRFSPASRKFAVNEIKRKAASNNFPRVMLFPEGTTSNGRFMLSFQHGAFVPGFPVQPVVVRYPYVHFDQSWGNISLAMLMFRMFTQFHNFMEVEYLPVVYPLESKHDSATHFAERTSNAMASALNVLQTSYAYGDVMIVSKAAEVTKQADCSNYMVEMAWAKNMFDVKTSETLEFLDQFLSMDPDSNGRVGFHEFSTAFGLGCCPLSEKIFQYFDVEHKGSISFRQYLVGSAHIRMQETFWGSCATAFEKCKNTSFQISFNELGDVLQLTIPCTDHNVSRLFSIFDIDKDKLISRDDFMTCLNKYPFLIALFTHCIKDPCLIEIV
ncbi:Lysophospholipid acyltransferase LPEAT2 [Rhynchospora pubera]|uniref:Lysophospholipid acyltransferase LPEAT2 n=1 Tax=Rhynchospora pubera TaxID=906938 RepID=A0AAV8EDT6_9POAL|nr:Lysophospholipid acyltransferase LPEAT2 [Rhynchospora pubera]